MTLKERLLETIASLPDHQVEETFQFVQRLQAPIRKVASICGGAARIRDTRIPVWTLVAYRNQGATDLELLENYPGLTIEDLQRLGNIMNIIKQKSID
jgi:uncharacterized protein (DUF433 family)